MNILIICLMCLGLFLFTTCTIGFLRFPDFYSRMHATGKGDTLGLVFCLLSLATYNLVHEFCWSGFIVSLKIMLIGVFWFLTGPTGTHAILRSAFDEGVMPWTKDGRSVIEWPPRRGR